MSAPMPAYATAYEFPADAEPGGSCALDAVNGAPAAGAAVKAGSQAMFAGWVVDGARQAPTGARFVLRGDSATYAIPLSADGPRPDVVAALGPDTGLASGYNLLSGLGGVERGNYATVILVADSPAVFCDLGLDIVVAD